MSVIRMIAAEFTVLLTIQCMASSGGQGASAAGTHDNQTVAKKGEGKPPNVTKRQQELENLQNISAALQIKEYEEKISQNLALFEDDTRFHTGAVSITVHKIPLSAGDSDGASSRDAVRIKTYNLKTSSVDIPLDKIRKLKPTIDSRGVLITELAAVVAEWKVRSGLPSNGYLELPENGSIFTVSYFLGSNKYYERRGFPVSYDVDLSNDFSEMLHTSSDERLKTVGRTCMWLNLTSNKWEGSGCRALIDTPRRVRCECNHTTTFAVLLSIQKTESVPQMVLSISYGFQGASIVALSVTIVFLLTARHRAGIDSTQAHNSRGMRSNRTNSQVSLCASLLCLHLVVQGSDLARKGSDDGCVAATALTHFFLLASAFWSFNEGLGIFIKTMPKLTLAIQFRQLTIIQLLFGWAFPVFITLVCLICGLGKDEYMDKSVEYEIATNKSGVGSELSKPKYDKCWLSMQHQMSLGAFVPMFLVIILNFGILFYITAVVVRMNRRVSLYQASSSNTCEEASVASGTSATPLAVDVWAKKRKFLRGILYGLRTFAVLVPILSVSWIFGLLANIPSASVAMKSIHLLVNGLQGLLIFLLFCIFGKRDWQRVKRKWKNSELRYAMRRYRNKRESVATIRRQTATYGTNASQPKVDVNHNAGFST